MKKLALCVVVCLACVSFGKTDIFGSGREFMFAANQHTTILRAGVEPVDGFQWGIAGQLFMDPKAEENHFRIDDSSWGLYLRYPFIDFESIPALPVKGNLFADASILIDIDDALANRSGERDPIGTLGIGGTVQINKNLSALALVQYIDRADVIKEDNGEIQAMFGILIQWGK